MNPLLFGVAKVVMLNPVSNIFLGILQILPTTMPYI